MRTMTVRELICKLAQAKNLDACVVLCELDREYEPISGIFDETVSPPDADGNIGVVSLTLSIDDRARRRYACRTKRKK